MKSFSGFIGILGVFLFVVGCGPASRKAATEKLIANASYSTISATSNILANGVAESVISITVRDQNNAAMTDIVPYLQVSGTGNQLELCTATDSNGSSTCILKSTKAETKNIAMLLPTQKNTTAVFVAGAPVKLGFAVQPPGGTANDSWVESPRVEVWDANNNLVSTASASVTLALQAGSGTLTGTLNRSTTGGQATFTGLKIDQAGTDKVLRASASGYASVDSSTFTIVAARAGATLSFSTQPGGGMAGAAWAQQPVVRVLANGSPDGTATDVVTLTLTSGSGSLLGTRTATAVGGVATFSGLNMTAIGAKALTASAPGVSIAVSNSFNIVPAAPASLSFAVQPGGGSVAVAWPQQPVLQVMDAYSNLATNALGSVSVALNSGTGTVLGTTTAALSSGSAAFSNLSMNIAGTKKIRATLGSLYIDSDSFVIGSGAATKLGFSASPGNGIAGTTWSIQPVVFAMDAYDNKASSFAGTISIALTTGTGAIQGTLGVAAVSGVSTFSGLKTQVAGVGKIITATSPGLTSIASGTFNIVAAPAYRMVLDTAPASSGVANFPLNPAPKVHLEDHYGNPIISGVDATAPFVATVATGTGTLAGSTTVLGSLGIATFGSLKVAVPGTKTLKITKADTTSGGGTGEIYLETGSHLAYVGTPQSLKFRTQPGGGTAGIAWLQQPVVEILDIAGNVVPAGTNAVSLAVSNGTMGILIGTTTQAGTAGAATFTNLRLNIAGNKTLLATSGTLGTATSGTFNVTHAQAYELTMGTFATGAPYNTNFGGKVNIVDMYGNPVTTGPDSTATVTASLLTGTGTLGTNKALAAVSGVVGFGSLQVSLIGAKTLKFTKEDLSVHDASGELSVTSGTINIRHGNASKLIITTQPTGASAGALLATQPVIEVRDAGDNVVLTSAAAITVAAVTSPTGTVLGGTTPINAVSGVATFSNLTLTKAGSSSLRFSSGSLTAATSNAFNITHGLASKMSVITQAGSAVAAVSFGTQPILEILDTYDNRVTTGPDASTTVLASLQTGTGTLSGSLTKAAVAGLITYDNLSINAVGAKTVRFTKSDTSGSGGTTPIYVDTASFTVNPGAASMLVMSQQPGGGLAGATWATPAQVAIQDANGYFVTTATNSVTATLATGTGVLSGTATVSAVAGIASFPSLTLNLIGTNKTLSFASGALIGATSNPFTITTGATAPTSVVSATPTSLPGNNYEESTITATLTDAYGNIAVGRTVTAASSRGATDTITGDITSSDATGLVRFKVKSATAGTGNITLTQGTVALSTVPAIVFSDAVPSATQSVWSISKATILNNGSDTATITMTIKNAAGVALQYKTVTLASSRGASDTITGSPATSNASGQVSFTVRSSTLGSARLTATSDSIALSSRIPLLVAPVAPQADLRAGYAYTVNFPVPGTGAQATWNDMTGNGNGGSLQQFAYSGASGWQGDGSTTVSSSATGPYRIGFDGSDDRVSLGTTLNSYGSFSAELWMRPESLTAKSVIFASSETSTVKGVTLRTSGDGTNRMELTTGYRNTYSDAVLGSSPTSYYRMNEASGTAMVDRKNAYAGTYAGSGHTFSANAIAYTNDRAIGFNGSSSYATVGTTLGNGTGSVTFEAWIYLNNNVSSTQAIISKEGSSSGLTLEVISGNYVQMRAWGSPFLSGAQNYTATGGTAMSTSTWYHVVGVRDSAANCSAGSGRSVSVYLNGSLQGCTNMASSPGSIDGEASANTSIGRNPSTGSNYFNGRIDEVAIYGAVLDASTALAHYNAGLVPTCYSSGAMATSTWYHTVVGNDSGSQTLSLAVNGTEVCSVTSPVGISGSAAPMILGAAVSSASALRSGSPWLGSIGEFRFYTQRLTGTQAGQLYSAGSSGY